MRRFCVVHHIITLQFKMCVSVMVSVTAAIPFCEDDCTLCRHTLCHKVAGASATEDSRAARQSCSITVIVTCIPSQVQCLSDMCPGAQRHHQAEVCASYAASMTQTVTVTFTWSGSEPGTPLWGAKRGSWGYYIIVRI